MWVTKEESYLDRSKNAEVGQGAEPIQRTSGLLKGRQMVFNILADYLLLCIL